MMMARMGVGENEVRVERLKFSGKEGKNSQGCPIAKWVCWWLIVCGLVGGLLWVVGGFLWVAKWNVGWLSCGRVCRWLRG